MEDWKRKRKYKEMVKRKELEVWWELIRILGRDGKKKMFAGGNVTGRGRRGCRKFLSEGEREKIVKVDFSNKDKRNKEAWVEM